MAKFLVSILETREYFYEIEADDSEEAGEIAKEEDVNNAIRDQHHESIVNWSEPREEIR